MNNHESWKAAKARIRDEFRPQEPISQRPYHPLDEPTPEFGAIMFFTAIMLLSMLFHP